MAQENKNLPCTLRCDAENMEKNEEFALLPVNANGCNIYLGEC